MASLYLWQSILNEKTAAIKIFAVDSSEFFLIEMFILSFNLHVLIHKTAGV